MGETDESLIRLLEGAGQGGLLGTSAEDAVRHSEGFARLVPPGSKVADLGSGAGLPGLVLALRVVDVEVVLIEASSKRADHLRRCVAVLDLESRVGVQECPAELVGHGPLRGSCDVVTARSFGPPAWVAECGAGLLRPGGTLVVSEPPGSDGERWAELRTSAVPLSVDRVVVDELSGGSYAVLVLEGAIPLDLPRRRAAAARDPIF